MLHSDRGSLFWQCRLSFENPAFAKYPRLPVRVCPGFTPQPAKESAEA